MAASGFTDIGLLSLRPRDLNWGCVCSAKVDASAIRQVIFPILMGPNAVAPTRTASTLRKC